MLVIGILGIIIGFGMEGGGIVVVLVIGGFFFIGVLVGVVV